MRYKRWLSMSICKEQLYILFCIFQKVSEGEITVSIPPKPSFRITISATATNIPPKLLNTGDFHKRFDENNERENFSTGPYMCPRKDPGCDDSADSDARTPVLNIVANQGIVTVHVYESGTRSDGSIHSGDIDT